MYTVDTALESLRKYDVTESDIQNWEKELNLEIPVDEFGRKQYSPHHINLFKNIKKHIALGRTLDEIRNIISLPPLVQSKPQATRKVAAQAKAQIAPKSPYASAPRTPSLRKGNGGAQGAAQVVNLVQRLTREKDQLYKKLLETEKLNSHLYSANNLFHKKVKDLTNRIAELQEKLKHASNEEERFKLMNDKAQLHKQLIAAEKAIQTRDEELARQKQANQALQDNITGLQTRIRQMNAPFDATKFTGDWMETGQLVEVIYDNFGINIEPERVRLFRISEKPIRVYGNTAVITTNYQYETNSLWRRNETMTISYIDEATLEGELNAEYILDGVPVAKAVYHVICRRQ